MAGKIKDHSLVVIKSSIARIYRAYFYSALLYICRHHSNKLSK